MDNSAQGAAWIFTRSSGTWSQQGLKLVGTGNIGAAKQGNAVSISADGNTAIIGGPADNSSIGATWVFTRNGSSWSQATKLIGTGNTGTSGQGVSVSLSADGSTALTGGNWNNSGLGAAWVFIVGPPVITSNLSVISAFGSNSTYNIATNSTPTSYNATGLPTGMSINTTTGAITINPSTAIGLYSITISATNAAGTGNATLNYNVCTGWIGGTGNWNNSSNWSDGSVPNGSADILISSGTPTLDMNLTVQTGKIFTLNGSGSLIIPENKVLTIAGMADFGGKSVTIKSSAIGSGSIGEITGTLSNASNVTVERYIPGLSSKRYRFLSTAVATNVADWRGEIFITGGGVSSEFTSVGLSNIKLNGLDWTLSGSPSMYGYTENLNSGSLNSRWEAITSGSSTLTIGKGYRVFIRGDRTNAGVLDNSVASQSSVIITSIGTINQGSKTLPATYNGASANDGWNLVGNPYPSTIDWNTSSGWTKTNVSPTIWIYNPSNNSYGNWDGSTITNSVTRYISSGQAFFIRTTGTPTFSCTEAVKTSTAGAAIFKTNPENTLRIGLAKNETNSDETVIRFLDGRNNEFNDDDDVRKFINSSVNVASNFGIDKYASVNYLDPKSLTDKVVQISAWVDSNGTYKLTFDGVNSFNSTPYVSLRDKFLNKLVDLRTTNTYQFNITNDSNSKNDNRFEVIFADKTSSLNENNLITSTYLNVYPNPAFDLLNINISSSFKNSDVVVYNISGMEVLKTNMAANNAQINIETLSNGIYFIKVSNQNGFNKTVKFVK